MGTKKSPQMVNLLKRYGVHSKKDLIRAIRDEYRVETGWCSLRDAELLLDGMLEAEYQRIEGGAYNGHQPQP